jgi:hypothetical protein
VRYGAKLPIVETVNNGFDEVLFISTINIHHISSWIKFFIRRQQCDEADV